jgi:hypothetical protein
MRGLGSVEKGLDAQKGLDAKAVAVLKQSFVEMGLLRRLPTTRSCSRPGSCR